jgi:hypothetical protein
LILHVKEESVRNRSFRSKIPIGMEKNALEELQES